ncbi:MAG TPA: hypothetical protein VK401_07520 [Propionibacteriaceae bacterium]|nr:hypothetical protein [Propionibacteriaceae bacterium]
MDGGETPNGTQTQQRCRITALAVDQPGMGQPVTGTELLEGVREKKRIGRSHVDAVHHGAPWLCALVGVESGGRFRPGGNYL